MKQAMITLQEIAAVWCSPDVAMLGGVKMGFWLTGKLGRAWVGAWVVHGLGARCWLGRRGHGLFV